MRSLRDSFCGVAALAAVLAGVPGGALDAQSDGKNGAGGPRPQAPVTTTSPAGATSSERGDGAGGEPAVDRSDAGLVIRSEDLTGAKRAQAAHTLLKEIHTGAAAAAELHRKFLISVLSPESLVRGQVPWISALSIVEELRSWIPREGLPYQEIARELQPLVGQGSTEFRQAVVEAVNVLVAFEKEQGQSSETLVRLKAKLSHQAPTENFLRDATAVLWRNDPRGALASLVTALDFYSRHDDGDTMMWACLEELRARLSVYFPTPELWQRWWKQVENLTLEEILVDYQRRSGVEYTTGWRRLMDRLRETRDVERVFLAIRDTLEFNSVDLRLAAVTALGEYAHWVRETPLRPEQTNEAKLPFLESGAELLLGVIEREQFPLESPDVIEAALASLRMYQGLVEKVPRLRKRLAENVVARLREFSRGQCTQRGIYLETVRVAGALGVTEALPYIETYLHDESYVKEDLELLSSAVTTLARLSDGASMRKETAELLMRRFESPASGSDKEARDLRLVCMIALERSAGNPEVRKELLGFYKKVVATYRDTVLAVRAILGLGVLVKANEAGALETMVEILGSREQYAPDVVLAVIDSIASYVSPPEALTRFLPFLSVQDKAVRDRLWSKVVGLVEAGGLANTALASRQLLMLGIEKENAAYFEQAESLFNEAPLLALLDPRKLDLGNKLQVTPWWNTMVHLIRIHDLRRQYGAGVAGDFAQAKINALRELQRQHQSLSEEHRAEITVLDEIDKAFQKRRDLLSGVLTSGDSAQVVAEFEALLRIEASPIGRRCHLLWIERQLGSIGKKERFESLRDASMGFLSAERNAALWDGLPDAFRGRFMNRLKELKIAAPPAPPPPGEEKP